MKLTLKWAGAAGDLKRAFVVAEENDGFNDLRIEVDTDDCNRDHALKLMQEVIDRCNLPADYRNTSEMVTLRLERDKIRSALLRVTGSLGLIIKGAGASGPGHKDNYEHATAVLDETC